MDEEDSFARGRFADPMGKLEPMTINIPADVAQRLREEASALGVSASQFTRDLLAIRLLGRDHALRMHAARIDRIAGTTTANTAESPRVRWEEDGD